MRKLSFFLAFALVLTAAYGAFAQATNIGAVSIDNVTNENSPTELIAGSTHTVSIRFNFAGLDATNPWGTGNTFEVYSPDGADWVDLLRGDGPIVTALPASVQRFRKYYTSTNDGVNYTQTASLGTVQPGGRTATINRVAYSLVTIDFVGATGFTPDVNGIALTIEFQTRTQDAALTMCVDSTKASGTVAWEWAAASRRDAPTWDNGLGVSGPRCWQIVVPQSVEVIDNGDLPTSFDVSQNYPNPFNPATTFEFALPKASSVELTIFNVLGQRVATLIDQELAAGRYRETWNGTSEGGSQVASGIYFYRLTAGDFVSTKKMMMLK